MLLRGYKSVAPDGAEIINPLLAYLELALITSLHLCSRCFMMSRYSLSPNSMRKRAIIESVPDQLKNLLQIEHSRHRSVANCFVNLLAGLVAYTYREKKPSLNIRAKEQLPLPALVF